MAHKALSVPPHGYSLLLGDRGRLVLPSDLRKQLGLKTGEKLVLTVDENGVMRMTTRRQRLAGARGMFASISPGRSLSEELIRERRREARLEDK